MIFPRKDDNVIAAKQEKEVRIENESKDSAAWKARNLWPLL